MTMETILRDRTADPVHALPGEDLGLDSLLLLAVAAAAVIVGFLMVLLAAVARIRT
ncbi:MAG: hypothetical protein QXO51_00545 [Halobacteria archaeon]